MYFAVSMSELSTSSTLSDIKELAGFGVRYHLSIDKKEKKNTHEKKFDKNERYPIISKALISVHLFKKK